MITVEVKDFDELMELARRLTEGVGNVASAAPASVPVFTAASAPAPVPQVPTAPTVQQAPVQPMNQGMPVQTPIQQTPAAVPTSAPSYTPDDLARAAMTLMDSGRQQELIGLLQNFGVSSLPELKPEQYGPFATALRGMGAQI